jgi:hypothetical protein
VYTIETIEIMHALGRPFYDRFFAEVEEDPTTNQHADQDQPVFKEDQPVQSFKEEQLAQVIINTRKFESKWLNNRMRKGKRKGKQARRSHF